MAIKVKVAGAYVDPSAILVKKGGLYSAVAGVYAKVAGSYQQVNASPVVPFDPLSNPKLRAYYSAYDIGAVGTQWKDQTANAFHATKVGNVAYEASNAVAGGRPAFVWPNSHVADCGFLIPAIGPVQEWIIVSAYMNGTENITTVGTAAIIFSGISGSSGAPVILFNQSGNAIFQSGLTGIGYYTPEAPTSGQDIAKTTPVTPRPFEAQNYRMASALTEVNWKFGYRDDSSPINSWRGPVSIVMVFSSTLTEEERYQYYGYLNTLMTKTIPVPTFVFERPGQLIVGVPSDLPPTFEAIPYYPCIQDMSGVPNFPFPYAEYYSTDHSDTRSGILQSVCSGDPYVPANWKTYNQALLDGNFNYIGSKPAANPIYEDFSSGNSTETGHTQVINGVVYMYYQQNGPAGYYSQATLLATSTDGVNFTRRGIAVQYPEGSAIGDGHTGYFIWAPNPFSGAINPATGQKWVYIGYGLHGGTNRGYGAQWGTDTLLQPDGVTPTQWTPITVLMAVRGRYAKNYAVPVYGSVGWAWNTIDLSSVQFDPASGGYRILMTLAPVASGPNDRINETYECLVAADGYTPLAMPIKAYPRGAAGTRDEYQVTIFDSVMYAGKRVFTYNGKESAANGNKDSVMVTRATPRAIDITKLKPTTPVVPLSLTTLTADFTVLGALPAWLTSFVIGTTTPTLTFSANGLDLTGTNVGAIPGEAYIFGNPSVIPNNVTMVDMWVEGWSTPTLGKQRYPMLGFADVKGNDAIITNAIFLDYSFVDSNTSDLSRKQRIATVNQTPAASAYYYGIGNGDYQSVSPKRMGLRWFPATGEMYLLGEAGHEFETFTLGAVNTAIGYFPMFGVKFNAAAVVERIKKITFRYG